MAASSPAGNTLGLIIASCTAAVVIVGIRYGLVHVFQYSVENSSLVVRMFKVKIYRVPLCEIDRAEVVPFASLVVFSRSFRPDLLISQKWCGYRSRVVAITKRSGWLKRIVISPESPELFASSLTPRSPERQ